jgi:hypothetical protein
MILAHTEAQISATENSYARQREECDREGNQGGMVQEGSKSSPTMMVMNAIPGVVIVAALLRQSLFQPTWATWLRHWRFYPQMADFC